jgi:hypothetical protein
LTKDAVKNKINILKIMQSQGPRLHPRPGHRSGGVGARHDEPIHENAARGP